MYIDKIKNFLKKLNISSLVFVYILLMNTTTIIPRLTSTYLKTYFYMAVVVAAFLFTLITCGVANIRNYLFLIAPFLIFQVIEMLSINSTDFTLAGYKVLLFMLPVCIGFYLVTHRFFAQLHAVLMLTMIAVTCLTTIIGCIKNPQAARILATTVDSQDVTAIIYDMQNIGGYNFVYSTVLLYPYVVLAFKMKKLNIFFVLLFTGLVWFMVIQAEYTIAVMLLLMSSLLFFVRKDITIGEFFRLLAIFFIVVLIFRVVIAAVLTHFAEMIGNQSMVEKISVLFLGKDSVTNFDDDRGALYMLSLEKFLKSPLFGMIGSNSRVTGGHSFILDNLALYGMIGGGLMIAMYRGIFVTIYEPIREKPCYAIAVWTFLQSIALSTINTGMWLNNLCMFAPVLLCAIYGEETYLGLAKPKPKPLIPVKTL